MNKTTCLVVMTSLCIMFSLFLYISRTPIQERYSQNYASVDPTYPTDINYVRPENLIQQADPMPNDLRKKVRKWYNKNREIELKIPTLYSQQELDEYKKKYAAYGEKLSSLSNNNIVVRLLGIGVIKRAGLMNELMTKATSLGFDPYNSKWYENDQLIEMVTSQSIPTQQHLSHIATRALLQKADNKLFVTPKTYAFHIPGKPMDPSDENYLIVQEDLGPDYVRASNLTDQQKQEFFSNVSLDDLYDGLKKGCLWSVSEDNLLINLKTGMIAYPDGEKPNNEGSTQNAKWKVAMFGQDFWKYRHAFESGFSRMTNIIQRYSPHRVAEWKKLYADDAEMHF